MLVEFNSKYGSFSDKDLFERTADVLLKPLRLSCGRFVKVDKELNGFYEATTSLTQKIFASFLTLLFFPVTIPLTLIGIALNANSSSYQEISKVFATREFVVPSRRYPPAGPMDSIVFDSNGRIRPLHFGTCVSNEEILEIHPMSFLISPFNPDQNTDADECNALALTKTGRHVILQQATRSCVPTAVAMLVLDNGGRPNFKRIQQICLATTEQAIHWLKEAGFKPKLSQIELENREQTFVELLQENGPGILGVIPPELGGHVIVLDAISLEKRTATIRDPYHGWMVTITLDALLRMSPGTLLQIAK